MGNAGAARGTDGVIGVEISRDVSGTVTDGGADIAAEVRGMDGVIGAIDLFIVIKDLCNWR